MLFEPYDNQVLKNMFVLFQVVILDKYLVLLVIVVVYLGGCAFLMLLTQILIFFTQLTVSGHTQSIQSALPLVMEGSKKDSQ